MTLKNHLLSIGTACAMVMTFVMAQTQSNPLPPGLVRAGSSASNTAPHMSPPPVVAPAPAPAPVVTSVPASSATGTRTSGSSLLGLPVTSASAATAATVGKTNSTALKFENTESSIVLMAYAAATGRTLIIAPDAPKATITLKSQPDIELTKGEYLEAIEKTLAINGIVLVPDGDKFLKVFAKGKVRTEGIETIIEEPSKPHPELGRTISQMITFKFLAVAEGQKALEGFKKPDGLFQVFERTNTILVTDTQENINRMLEIVKFIDKPIEITDEVNVRPVKFAKAEDIKKRIEELVTESQKQQQAKEEIKANTSGAPGISRSTMSTPSILGSRLMPPGLVRPNSTPTPVLPNETLSAMVSDADRGMIRGKVQVIADERSNKLIIVTRPENMRFFDKIIEVLDVPTAADIQVKIIRLQYATADSTGTKDGEKGIADILNELIGNASAAKSTTSSKSSSSSGNKRSSPYPTPSGNQNLTSPTPAPTPTPTPRAPSADREGTGKVGELSKENITILADKRINGLIVMASPTDMAIIEALIKELDVELEQVIIETVLLQVKLNDSIKTGIDWIHSNVMSKNGISAMGGGGGGANKPPEVLSEAAGLAGKFAGGVTGAKYYFLFDNLNLNMVVQASKEDSRTKVLQSPVLMTVNNKEAVLESTDMAYLYKGVRASGGGYGGSYQEVPDYEQRDFGVTIKVTPRISPNGNVTLTVDQKFETRGADQSVGSSGGSNDVNSVKYPTISTTKLQADVSVKSGQTIMLGGLIKSLSVVNDNGIPILKDIPLIGRYLFGSTENTEESSELMVFLTPHVVKGSTEAQSDARRRLENTNTDGVWSKGWSNSELAEPPKFGDMLSREYRKKEQLKKEVEAEKRLQEFDQRHSKAGVRTNLLYNQKYNLPPPSPEKQDGKTTTTKEILPQKPATVLSSGQMRVIEEKTEPVISNPSPAPAHSAVK
ncbi:MAG: secretin N-terminal domain-containing protein [bacterium]